jgi:UDP-N-acetylmuramoyl-L-alanyl-D-glutamate--2,6-diaminopimelate ligase
MDSYVILTNENPRMEDPGALVSEVVAGFPDDLVNRYAGYAYFPFQDQGRTPLWFEPYLQKAQRDNRRCAACAARLHCPELPAAARGL